MKRGYVLPAISASMPFQMALDEILFRALENHETIIPQDGLLLRFYFSSEPWISIGYADRVTGQEENGVPVCRRLTGGGKVYHGNDLIFSIVALKSHDESFRSVTESYLKIHEAVKDAFETLKLPLRFYRPDQPLPKGNECFVFPIETDLAFGKEKVAGGSQKRSSGALLHEESIKLVANLSADELMPALCGAFEKKFEIKFQPLDLDPQWMRRAEQLAKERN